MRPVRLSLEGFTCFGEAQPALDLQGLDLVAISGATGAGKSSLLDAMIFALFGKVPRMGRHGVSELITLGQDRMSVRFDFELGDSIYRVARVVHRRRATQAILERRPRTSRSEDTSSPLTSPPTEFSPMADGVKNVRREIEGLLGFDYETFIRAVILPQGEFAAFLKSEPSKRRQILRDLLRLHVYEEMRRTALADQKTLEARINSDVRRLDEDFGGVTSGELEARRSRVDELQQAVTVAETEVTKQRRWLAETRRQRELCRELEEKRSLLANLSQRRGEIERFEAQVEAARRAAPTIPHFEMLAERIAEAADLRRVVEREHVSLATAEAELATARQTLELEQVGSLEIPQLRRRTEALSRVSELLTPARKAKQRCQELDDKQRSLSERLAVWTDQARNTEQQCQDLSERVTASSRDLVATGYDTVRDQRLDAMRDPALRLVERRRESSRAQSELRQTTERRDAADRALLACDAAVRSARQHLEAASELRHRAELAWKQAEHQHHVASLRHSLAVGEPCPVCEQSVVELPTASASGELGNLDTALEQARQGEDAARRALETEERRLAVSSSELKAAKLRFDEAAGRADELTAEVKRARAELERQMTGLGDHGAPAGRQSSASAETFDEEALPEDAVLAEVEGINAQRAAHTAAGEVLQRLESQLQDTERERDQQATEAERLTLRQQELEADLQTARAELTSYTQQIRQVTEAEDPAAERREVERQIAQLEDGAQRAAVAERELAMRQQLAAAAAEKAQKLAEVALAKVETVRHAALKSATDGGFGDEAAVRSAALDIEEQQRLDHEIESYHRHFHPLQQRVDELEADIDGKWVHAVDIGEQETVVAAAETEERTLREQSASLAGSLGELERRVALRAEIEAGLTTQRADQQRMAQLARDLQSDKFQAYLLEKTFQDLVHGASLRLMELSQQRYALHFDQDSFHVIDHDHASQLRSADTLSGGETFLASIALALELSEQIQRQAGAVTLDSIFIDEGFGSLDPETLETVASAIESLPTGGRMVGLITHLPELTRRLRYRILVEKNASGSRYRVEEG